MALSAGDTFTVRYPFIRCHVPYMTEHGDEGFESWRPGTFAEGEDPYGGSWRAMADGEGSMTLTVISTHKPGKYLERVFFTRKFRDPDGVEFGKPALRMVTRPKFDRTARGYRCDFGVRLRPYSEWAAAQSGDSNG